MVGSPLQSSSPREKEKKGENSQNAYMGTFSCGRSPPIYKHFDAGLGAKLVSHRDTRDELGMGLL